LGDVLFCEFKPRSVATYILAAMFLLLFAACGGGGSSGGSGGGAAGPQAPTAPGAASITTITVGDGSLSLVFGAPLSNGGSAVTGYTATCSAASAAKTASAASSPLAVTGLQNGIEYSCTVVAINAVGAGPASSPVTATPAAARTTSVTPILGGFSAGVTVEIFRSDTGAKIAQGTTADDGKATITYSSAYSGIQIIKITGSPTAKYYDERSDSLQPFAADKVLLTVVPAAVASQQTSAVAATVLTHSIAISAGVDASSSSAVAVPTTFSVSAVKAATDKVLSTFGLDPTKVYPLNVPAYLGVKDQGTGAKLQGTEAALTYGAALIAITQLTPPNTDVASFTQTIATSIKTDTVKQTVPQIATLPQVFQQVVATTVAPAAQQTITSTPTPGSSPWDTAIWDAANWF
jgi:hypothetical protein